MFLEDTTVHVNIITVDIFNLISIRSLYFRPDKVVPWFVSRYLEVAKNFL